MSPLKIAIIGGGFTGIIFAVHAARAARCPLAITVIEPARDLGRGIAYGTHDPAHRINVPSQRMAVLAGDPDGPTRWFFAAGVLPDAASQDAQGQSYVSRYDYGSFIQDLLRQTLDAAGTNITLEHEVDAAAHLRRHARGWHVALRSGRSLTADIVVLCFGHTAPALPCPTTDAVLAHPKFVVNPWNDNALALIDRADHVLIAGTGLTMADTVASLQARAHDGPITAVSRRGLLPRTHGLFANNLPILDNQTPPTTALGLLRLVRQSVRRHAAVGWHPALDSVRTHLPILWPALSASEKRRVVRRLLPFWEVHRFRIAPQVQATLTDACRRGQLAVVSGALESMSLRDGRFAVALRHAGARPTERTCDAVILCTGPQKDLRRHPFAASLLDAGQAQLDDVGMGLAVDRDSRVFDGSGRPQDDLLAFGPLTRGTFGEMTGAPDIARHVESAAIRFFERAPDA